LPPSEEDQVRYPTLLAAGAAALALAACGGSGSAEDTAAKRKASFEDAQLKFVRCLRAEGIEVKDPEDGKLVIGSSAPSAGKKIGPAPEKFQRAQEKCEKYLREAGPPPELSKKDQAEFERQALAFTRCMREHGVNLPDPEIEGAGVRQRIPEGVNPRSPRFRKAEQDCSDLMPKKRRGTSDGPELSAP
jgi:hypothetical protein